jgi:hypothetical protein
MRHGEITPLKVRQFSRREPDRSLAASGNEARQALHHSALTRKASADSSRMAWEGLAHSQVQQEFMRVLAQDALASAIP